VSGSELITEVVTNPASVYFLAIAKTIKISVRELMSEKLNFTGVKKAAGLGLPWSG